MNTSGQPRRSKLSIVAQLLVCLSLLLAPALALAAEDMPLLFTSNSEKEVELAIGKYLEKRGIKYSMRVYPKDPEDIYLSTTFTKEGREPIQIFIDTDASWTMRDTGEIRARHIYLWSYVSVEKYKGLKSGPRRTKMLEFINQWMNEYWAPGKVYLDDDGDLRLQWDINIPDRDTPVHAEQVADAIERMVTSWRTMEDRLEAEGI